MYHIKPWNQWKWTGTNASNSNLLRFCQKFISQKHTWVRKLYSLQPQFSKESLRERKRERVDKQISKHYRPSEHIPPITVWQSKTAKKNSDLWPWPIRNRCWPLISDLDLFGNHLQNKKIIHSWFYTTTPKLSPLGPAIAEQVQVIDEQTET